MAGRLGSLITSIWFGLGKPFLCFSVLVGRRLSVHRSDGLAQRQCPGRFRLPSDAVGGLLGGSRPPYGVGTALPTAGNAVRSQGPDRHRALEPGDVARADLRALGIRERRPPVCVIRSIARRHLSACCCSRALCGGAGSPACCALSHPAGRSRHQSDRVGRIQRRAPRYLSPHLCRQNHVLEKAEGPGERLTARRCLTFCW